MVTNAAKSVYNDYVSHSSFISFELMSGDEPGNSVDMKILSKLTQLIRDRGYDGPIRNDSKLRDDFGFDSLDITELMISVEEEFDIEIPDEDIASIITFNDLLQYVQKKVK